MKTEGKGGDSQKGFNPNGCCVARQLGASDLVGNYAKRKNRKKNKQNEKKNVVASGRTENKMYETQHEEVKIFGLNPRKTFYMIKRSSNKFVTNEKLFPVTQLGSSKRRVLYIIACPFVVWASFHGVYILWAYG